MSGVTRTIREQLNFHDEKLWKQFSTRRLELIDKFNLSSKKASEQDDSILQIASLLRDEFEFPHDTLPEFDRLVRAAVQSVRRNRKRSSRARVSTDRFVQYGERDSSRSTQQPHPASLFYSHRSQQSSASSSGMPSSSSNQPSQHQQQQQHLKRLDFNFISSTPQSTSSTSSIANSPPAQQRQLPSIRMITATTDTTKASDHSNALTALTIPQTGQHQNELSQSSQKLLNYIHRSRSCLQLSNNESSIHEDNLYKLGSSIITASLSFILERYFGDISSESINYLFEKLESLANLTRILKSLGGFSSDVMVLSETQANSLLAKLIGCCVKDFGFDAITYTLSEMFHEIVLKEYPLVATQVNKITPESLYTPLMPIKPKDADAEISKSVKLQFGHRVLDFKFAPLSSAPPTYLELLENGKVAFAIQGKNLRLRFQGEDITEDSLERLFRDIERREIVLELYEPAQLMKFTPLL